MVKSTQGVASDDAAAALNRSTMWGIFVQAEMGPCRTVPANDGFRANDRDGIADIREMPIEADEDGDQMRLAGPASATGGAIC
jgi:hypothetical protein